MPATESELFALLDRLGIRHETRRHPPVFTVEESRALRGVLPGAHVKNLVLRDKSGQAVLAVVEESRKVDIKALAAAVGLGRLSFAAPEMLRDRLGVTPGSVTPLALMNAAGATDLRVALDRRLAEAALVNVHPLHNAATTSLAAADLLRFMRHCGFEPRILDFPES